MELTSTGHRIMPDIVIKKSVIDQEPINKKAHRILTDCVRIELPVLPRQVRTLLAMAGDSDLSMADMAYIVLSDPCMSINFLRIGNSAFYAPGKQRVIQMQNILVLLGLDNIVSTLLSFPQITTSGPQELNKTNPVLAGYLSRSAIQMKIAMDICSHIGLESQILPVCLACSDLGMLVLSITQPHISRFLWTLMKRDSVMKRTAKKVIGRTPVQLGLEIARHWNLPMTTRRTIALVGGINQKDAGLIEGLALHIHGWIMSAALDNSERQTFHLEMLRAKTGFKYMFFSNLIKESLQSFARDSVYFYQVLELQGLFRNLMV